MVRMAASRCVRSDGGVMVPTRSHDYFKRSHGVRRRFGVPSAAKIRHVHNVNFNFNFNLQDYNKKIAIDTYLNTLPKTCHRHNP